MKASEIAAELLEKASRSRNIAPLRNPGVQRAMTKLIGPREPLLDQRELSAHLGITTTTLMALCKRGLPCYNIGNPGGVNKRRRFKMSEVDAWMKANVHEGGRGPLIDSE